MNIKKLTLIATAVSALSLSPLTYAAYTESTDKSILGMEPECDYFVDVRFNLSPFSTGGIAIDKDIKSDFDKYSLGGSANFGTEFAPGFEGSIAVSVATNIGTDSVSCTSVSSSSSTTTTTTTPASSSTTSGVKKLEENHRKAYNEWLSKNTDVSNFLYGRLDKAELHKILAKDYSIRGMAIREPANQPANNAQDILNQHRATLMAHQLAYNGGTPYYNRLVPNDNQNYGIKFANLLTELNKKLQNQEFINNLKSAITTIKDGNDHLTDRDKDLRIDRLRNAVLGNNAAPANIDALTNAQIGLIRNYTYQNLTGTGATAADIDPTHRAIINGITFIQTLGNVLAPRAGDVTTIFMGNMYLGAIQNGCAPVGFSQIANAIADGGARTPGNAYSLRSANAAGNLTNCIEEDVREVFYHSSFVSALLAFSDMIAFSSQDVGAQLNKMVTNILSSQKGTPQYKKLVEGFAARLKSEGIIDRSAEEIIDAIAAEYKAADDKAKDNKTADTTTTDKKTDSTKKDIENVNFTKFRLAAQGAFRVIDNGSLSLSVMAGVGVTAVTGTIAGEETGYMMGADIYGGLQGLYNITESIGVLVGYTYSHSLGGHTLKADSAAQKKVNSLGHSGNTVVTISMHELAVGMRISI